MTQKILSTVVAAVIFVAGFAAIVAVSEPDEALPGDAVTDEALLEALAEIFPDAAEFTEFADADDVFVALDGEMEPVGYAAYGEGEGYGGTMQVLTGVGLDGVISGAVLMEHSETAGFVDDVTDPEFRAQFVGKSAADTISLGDDIDGVSGATGSAEGFTAGVRNAVDRLADLDDIAAPDDDGADEIAALVYEIVDEADDIAPHDDLDDVWIVTADGQTVGYAAFGIGEGYGGDMQVLVVADTDGVILGSDLLEHSETAGFVDDVTDPAFRERFVGRTGDDPIEIDNDIDGVSGATGSATGYAAGVRAALEAITEAR